MRYHSGEEVKQGDIVALTPDQGDEIGVVVSVLEPGSPEAIKWGVEQGGVLVEGGSPGLSLTRHPESDPELILIRRGDTGR